LSHRSIEPARWIPWVGIRDSRRSWQTIVQWNQRCEQSFGLLIADRVGKSIDEEARLEARDIANQRTDFVSHEIDDDRVGRTNENVSRVKIAMPGSAESWRRRAP